mgnify:CR=1 FL=1
MNAEIQTFNFNDNPVRTLTDENVEPWFVAKDVCDILTIDTNHLSESLDHDEMNTIRLTEGNTRGNPNKTIISEPGRYTLVMRSRKPEAKEFKRWVMYAPCLRMDGQQRLDIQSQRLMACDSQTLHNRTPRNGHVHKTRPQSGRYEIRISPTPPYASREKGRPSSTSDSAKPH